MNITDRELYIRNAKTQVTLWDTQEGSLYDYAYKTWGGLVGSFYSARWTAWFGALQSSLSTGKPYDEGAMTASLQALEEAWTLSDEVFPENPSEDNPWVLAQAILQKFFSDAPQAARSQRLSGHQRDLFGATFTTETPKTCKRQALMHAGTN
jgi:alpha-N-acetylglucosaminidase